eukprot:COSAG01_NODE_5470_length_4241_cov_3.935297_1_plen_48_part_10
MAYSSRAWHARTRRSYSESSHSLCGGRLSALEPVRRSAEFQWFLMLLS